MSVVSVKFAGSGTRSHRDISCICYTEKWRFVGIVLHQQRFGRWAVPRPAEKWHSFTLWVQMCKKNCCINHCNCIKKSLQLYKKTVAVKRLRFVCLLFLKWNKICHLCLLFWISTVIPWYNGGLMQGRDGRVLRWERWKNFLIRFCISLKCFDAVDWQQEGRLAFKNCFIFFKGSLSRDLTQCCVTQERPVQ